MFQKCKTSGGAREPDRHQKRWPIVDHLKLKQRCSVEDRVVRVLIKQILVLDMEVSLSLSLFFFKNNSYDPLLGLNGIE